MKRLCYSTFFIFEAMHWVFNNEVSFEERALRLFREQAASCPPYREYLSCLGVDAEKIDTVEDIPFLPIQFFKTHAVIAEGKEAEVVFSSSGTTGMQRSQHRVADVSLYEASFQSAFQQFYGDPKQYRILALLPSYLEREGSSLIYMCEALIKQSEHKDSGFYLHNLSELAALLKSSEAPTLLLGVTYALLDLLEHGPFDLKQTIVMETGGMKGKRKELLKSVLHEQLCEGFGVNTIHSEYGMTELLSQAYSKGGGLFHCPPWMKVLARDIDDPLSLERFAKTGGLNIIDLANVHSCAFIATQDLGRVYADGSFEVMGRFEQADMRGCNLLVQ
jgi:phenylacetate-coenzyme A ligase PaaK-like adenylate-forming protein